MITEKTNLQEKFNKIPNIDVGLILKFNDDEELVPVNPATEGIRPQIKVISVAGYTVTCKKKSNSAIVSLSANYPANTWYFNVPDLNIVYTITVITSNSTQYTYEVTPTEYKQYVVNAVS